MTGALLTGARAEVNTFLAAVMFLTRVPVGAWQDHREEDLPRSSVYFPLVGALIGLCGGVILLSAFWFLPPLVTVLAAMGVMIVLTGGLHEDGLADTADGLWGGRTIERRLEIMKDSRIGSYGAIALWFGLTAKFVLLETLLQRDIYLAFCALIAANALGRMSTVALLHFCRYARSGESKASSFGDAVSLREFGAAGLLTVVIVILVLGLRAPICAVAAVLTTGVARIYFQSKLRGITGDCLGASNQLVELSCYLALILPLNVGAA